MTTTPSAPRLRRELPAAGGSQRSPADITLRNRLDVEEILSLVGETAYVWNLRTDLVTWLPNATDVLKVASSHSIATGTSLHLLIASENAGIRHAMIREAKADAGGNGTTYRLEYRFCPNGRRSTDSVWLEEQGHWLAGPDGRPAVAKGIVRRIDERRTEQLRLQHLSERDALTGLINSSRILDAINHAVADEKSRGRSFALLLASITNLAMINETFGYGAGNDVITEVSARLAAELRSGDIIGRLSSNKLAIVVHSCEADGLQAAARRLFTAVQDTPIDTRVGRISCRLSIGAAHVPLHAATAADAIGAALDALSEAKSRRSDRFVCYDGSPQRASLRSRNVALAEAIIAALDEDRMEVALQPIVRADTGAIAFHECLLRMEQPDGTLVSAGEFVRVAEQLGLAHLIDRRVLELAVGLVRNDPGLTISFNVSGLTARDNQWVVALHNLIGGDRDLAGRLIVEITETSAIEDLDECVAFVDTLKEIGCKVAIDDFGAGYTSFRNLKHLGADIVKIDGSFVRQLGTDPSNLVFIETLVGLASRFGMETVAEWVIDEATAEALRPTGVTYLQGYHFGAPRAVVREGRRLRPSTATG